MRKLIKGFVYINIGIALIALGEILSWFKVKK